MKTLYRYFVCATLIYIVIRHIYRLDRSSKFNYECLANCSRLCRDEIELLPLNVIHSQTCDYRQPTVCHMARHLVRTRQSACYNTRRITGGKRLNVELASKQESTEFRWLLERHEQIKEHWNGTEPNSDLTVVVYMGLLDPKSHMDIRSGLYTGGPLGEMIQWSSLLAAIDSFTTELTVVTSMAGLNLTKGMCLAETSLANADVIITDIIGAKLLKTIGSNFYASVKCRLRVLDSFGTDAFFNHPSMAESSGYKNPWGRLDLHLSQFLTFYPQEHNSFIGFTTDTKSNQKSSVKDNIAVVYGKRKQYFEGHERFLKDVGQIFDIHTTISDDDIYAERNGFTNHPNLDPSGFNRLLAKAKIFIGLGFPYEGPSPIEALQNGAYFLNAKLEPPVSRSEEMKVSYIRDFFNDKPTFRRLNYQVPYLATVNTSYIINVPLEMTDDLRTKLQIIQRQSVFERQPMSNFTAPSLLSRVKQLLHINYCLALPLVSN